VPHDVFSLDLRQAPDEARRWMALGVPIRSIGSAFRADHEHRLVVDPAAQWDAVVVVRRSTAARRQPSGRRIPQPRPATVGIAEPALTAAQAGGPPAGWSLVDATDGQPWSATVVRHGEELAVLVVREVAAWSGAGVVLTRALRPEDVSGRRLRIAARLAMDDSATGDARLFAVAVDRQGRTHYDQTPRPDGDVQVAEVVVPGDAVDVRVGVRVEGADPVRVVDPHIATE
jgi:hypothetical protein